MLFRKFLFSFFILIVIAFAVLLQFITAKKTDQSKDFSTEIAEELTKVKPVNRSRVVTDNYFISESASQARRLRKSTDENRAKVISLIQNLQSDDDYESVDALLEAQDLDTVDLISFVESALNLPGKREIRQEAFELILGYDNPALLPLIEQAFNDSDSEMRLAALEALEGVGGEKDEDYEEPDISDDIDNDEPVSEELSDTEKQQILAMLEAAFNDVDPDVREQAMKTLLQMEYDLQVEGFKLALQSSFDDVRSDAMHVTSTSANQDTILLAIFALDDPDPTIKESAQENLEFYIGKTFETSEEALKWWQTYKHLFDDDLFLEDLENLYIIEDDEE